MARGGMGVGLPLSLRPKWGAGDGSGDTGGDPGGPGPGDGDTGPGGDGTGGPSDAGGPSDGGAPADSTGETGPATAIGSPTTGAALTGEGAVGPAAGITGEEGQTAVGQGAATTGTSATSSVGGGIGNPGTAPGTGASTASAEDSTVGSNAAAAAAAAGFNVTPHPFGGFVVSAPTTPGIGTTMASPTWGGQDPSDFGAGFARGLFGTPGSALSTLASLALFGMSPSPTGLAFTIGRGLTGAARSAVSQHADAMFGPGAHSEGDLAAASQAIANTPGVTTADTGPSSGPGQAGGGEGPFEESPSLPEDLRRRGPAPAAPTAAPTRPRKPTPPSPPASPITRRRFGGMAAGV